VGEIELVALRAKKAFHLLLALILLVGTIFALHADQGSIGSAAPLWLGIPLCVAASGVFGWQAIKPPRLVLGADGFTFEDNIRSARKVAWRDTENFFVWRSGRGNTFIGYKLKPEARSGSILAKANHRVGADGILPNIWPVSPECLATQMNAVRQGGLANMQHR
jgi:hypothetical protein